MCVCLLAAYSFQVLVSKKLASNLPQSITLFEHCKSLVRSMKNAQLSFIDQRNGQIALLYINKCLIVLNVPFFGDIKTVFITYVVGLLARGIKNNSSWNLNNDSDKHDLFQRQTKSRLIPL